MRQCDTAIVVINVLDFNDEVPRFDLAEYAVDICHTAMAGEPLVQPVATDRDSGVNADLTYTIQVNPGFNGHRLSFHVRMFETVYRTRCGDCLRSTAPED